VAEINNKNVQMRSNVLTEILQTERSYIQDLTVLMEVFLKPLREKSILSGEELNAIFLNVEIIFAVNQQLLTKLEATLSTTTLGESHIGAVFTGILDFLKMYAFYCSNYKKGIEKKAPNASEKTRISRSFCRMHQLNQN